jgi:hypothetical protein
MIIDKIGLDRRFNGKKTNYYYKVISSRQAQRSQKEPVLFPLSTMKILKMKASMHVGPLGSAVAALVIVTVAGLILNMRMTSLLTLDGSQQVKAKPTHDADWALEIAGNAATVFRFEMEHGNNDDDNGDTLLSAPEKSPQVEVATSTNTTDVKITTEPHITPKEVIHKPNSYERPQLRHTTPESNATRFNSKSNSNTTLEAGQSKSLKKESKVKEKADTWLEESAMRGSSERKAEFMELVRIHQSEAPALSAGNWEYNADLSRHSNAELQCLSDLEPNQGHCNANANLEGARLRRLNHSELVNSPGMFDSHDPYFWTSNSDLHQVLSLGDDDIVQQSNKDRLKVEMLNRTVYLIGDSLTRQWTASLQCELMHVFNLTQQQAESTIQYKVWMGRKLGNIDGFLNKVTRNDYVIFNMGHHNDFGKVGKDWKEKFQLLMADAIRTLQKVANKSDLPEAHILFRSISVRHFHAGLGDWNTKHSMSGGTAPNMNARWLDYGGNSPAQPFQNLAALKLIAETSNFGFLDTAPLTLARADTTADGSHFCLPGPHNSWSRMLYHRILNER